MDVKAGKLKAINDILTFKSSCTGFPGLKLTNSLPSINNLLNAIAFLLDLIKTIVGVDALKEKLVEILSYEVEGFELAIKKILKSIIKEVFSCGISPTIPQDLINIGLDFDLERIDIFSILKIDPQSIEGSIVFVQPNPITGVGNDFNYFLSETIQSGFGVPNLWKTILIVTYNQSGIIDGQLKNNVINVKIHPSYTSKTIFQFLNDFIDSIRFLPESTLTPKVIDNVFGTISSAVSKSLSEIKKDSEFEEIVDKILSKSNDVETEIDNTYLEFSNEEKFRIEQRASLLSNGVTILEECQSTPSKISLSSLQDLVSSLSGVTTAGERKVILSQKLDKMAIESTSNIDRENKKIGELAFFLKLIKGLIMVILKSVVGPAVVLIISLYLKLAYGFLNFNDLKEFIKNNLKFYTDLIKKIIVETIQRVLITFLINILKELIICNLINNKKQMIKQYQLSLNGLTSSGPIAQALELVGQLQQLGLA
jgi:hypothetical protein